MLIFCCPDLCICAQPNPSNKLAIIHILGLLSNLFTTLDISNQDDESGDGPAPPVKTTPPPPGPNPVSIIPELTLLGVASGGEYTCPPVNRVTVHSDS